MGGARALACCGRRPRRPHHSEGAVTFWRLSFYNVPTGGGAGRDTRGRVCSPISTAYLRRRLCGQRGANQFGVAAREHLAIRIGRRRPGAFLVAELVGWFQQTRPADFAVPLWREFRPDQVPLVGEKKNGIAAWSQMDAGAVSRFRHRIRLPDLFPAAGFQADKFAGSSRRVNVAALHKSGRCVATRLETARVSGQSTEAAGFSVLS